MKLKKLVEKIQNNYNPKTKHKYNLDEVLEYIHSLNLSYLWFWLVMDYMEDNNLIIK